MPHALAVGRDEHELLSARSKKHRRELRRDGTALYSTEQMFALDDDRPLTASAGIWTNFNGERGTKSKPTTPNAVVGPIHPKAMPVILTTDEGRDVLDAGAMG